MGKGEAEETINRRRSDDVSASSQTAAIIDDDVTLITHIRTQFQKEEEEEDDEKKLYSDSIVCGAVRCRAVLCGEGCAHCCPISSLPLPLVQHHHHHHRRHQPGAESELRIPRRYTTAQAAVVHSFAAHLIDT